MQYLLMIYWNEAEAGKMDAAARQEMSAGEVQEALGIPGPTLSHHFESLRRAGLIEARRQERFIYYSVGTRMVNDLVRLLTACC